jgi:hypothetical protein
MEALVGARRRRLRGVGIGGGGIGKRLQSEADGECIENGQFFTSSSLAL